RPRDRVDRTDRARAEVGEELLVALASLEAERRRGRDDGDAGIAAAGERDEPAQDHPIPDLVLRSPDDDHGAIGHRPGEYTGAPRAGRPGPGPCENRGR